MLFYLELLAIYHVDNPDIGRLCKRKLFLAQEKSSKIQKVHFFVTSSIVAIKSASRPSTFCDNQSCITNAQSNFAADGCTIYTKTEP